jgi:MATE family multidrug resistance protein
MKNATLFSLAIHGVLLALLIPGFGTHGLWAVFTVLMIPRAMTLGFYYPCLVKSV